MATDEDFTHADEDLDKQVMEHATTNIKTQEKPNPEISLPPGKRYAYFASHKKQHTRFGDSSADLARALKDLFK